jgi:hypothetical protein
MKAKQLPGGLEEWLKTRTIVIGGVNSLAGNSHRPARQPTTSRGNWSVRHPQRLFVC